MILNEKTLVAILSRSKSPLCLPSLDKRERNKELLVIAPRLGSRWAIVLTLSHSRDLVRGWLLRKLILEALSKYEKLVLQLLLVGSDEEFCFLKEITDFDFLKQTIASRMAFIQKMKELFPFMREHQTLRSRGMQPSLIFNRFWFEKKELAPKRYIGVGYKDKGSLHPSTQVEERTEGLTKAALYRTALLSFRIIFRLPLPVSDIPGRIRFTNRGSRPADDDASASKRVKRISE